MFHHLMTDFWQVLQFLTHDGYVETAREFANEVHSEKKALNMDPDVTIQGFDIKDDQDASHRQREYLWQMPDINTNILQVYARQY